MSPETEYLYKETMAAMREGYPVSASCRLFVEFTYAALKDLEQR